MKNLFTGLITLFLSVNATALPLHLWEAGGQFHDIHLQDDTLSTPNTNPEKNVVYFNTSADSAGFTNNSFRITDPVVSGNYPPVGMFWGSQGLDIDAGSSFELGKLKLYNWGFFEGDISLDLRARFEYDDAVYGYNQYKDVDLNLLLTFQVFGEGEDRAITFKQVRDDASFSINGEDYVLSFDSVCQSSSPINCPTELAWLTPGEMNSEFSFNATLKNKTADVPEPSSLGILFAGLVALAATRRRKHA